ncbi:MAG: long-subunit acyl-CoA synthetase (AMP-forming) [Polaribacter sp.]|jgi:long-subunit acyl-CoA synthetase (AMP-forming)
MSINSLEKVFHAADFLEQFNVSTQKQAHIKKLIVQSFNELQKDN